eukprot:scaffold45886_cov39-Prasinocladus_malaysianus.AAC.1
MYLGQTKVAETCASTGVRVLAPPSLNATATDLYTELMAASSNLSSTEIIQAAGLVTSKVTAMSSAQLLDIKEVDELQLQVLALLNSALLITDEVTEAIISSTMAAISAMMAETHAGAGISSTRVPSAAMNTLALAAAGLPYASAGMPKDAVVVSEEVLLTMGKVLEAFDEALLLELDYYD